MTTPITNPATATLASGRAAGDLPVIADPALREIADRLVRVCQVAAEKALAHDAYPAQFPLPADPNSLEQVVRRHALRRPEARRKEAAARAIGELTASGVRIRGDLDPLDLRSTEAIDRQFLRLASPEFPVSASARPAMLSQAGDSVVGDLERTPALADSIAAHVGQITGSILSAIDKKWNALGGANGFLGNPTSPETSSPDGVGRYRHYQGGSIYWTRQTGAHEVHGAIRERWNRLGAERSFLGYPLTDETLASDRNGRFSHFQGGSVYWTPNTGAHEVHGAIREKWQQFGGEQGYLGYPVIDETVPPDLIGRFSHFQGGSVYWTLKTGAWAVHSRVREAWAAQGWELGSLGYPVSDTTGVGGAAMSNLFQGGRVDWREGEGGQVVRTMTKLQLRLRSVNCVTETGTTSLGEDEIDFSGVATDAALRSTLVNRFRVSDFDSGDSHTFSPPRVVHTFDLLDPTWWPKSYVINILLAEIDSGGFNDTLREFLEAIRGIVEKELARYAAATIGLTVGTYVGGAAGSVIPGIGTAVGAAVGALIGALVGYLVGEFFGWLIGMFDDDVFPPIPVPIDIPSVHQRWAGAAITPEWYNRVTGHGGVYEIRGDWVLVP
jgi:hypothetical protein